MHDYRVNKHNLNEFVAALIADISERGEVIVSTQPAAIGEWGMSKLWRVWMGITHQWLKGNNVKMPVYIDESSGLWTTSKHLSLQDTHEMFTLAWLGVDSNGKRLTWSMDDKGACRAATQGERLFCMQQHEQWALNNGINLFKPRGNEMSQLEKQTNE